jgi:hypothetical protein
MGRLEDGVFPGIRHRRVTMPSEDGVMMRILEREFRARHKSTHGSGAGRDAGAASGPSARLEDGQEVMQTFSNQQFTACSARGARLVQQAGGAAHAAPHRTPVLPGGWAPLTIDQQRAVLQACDAAPNHLTFRLGSLTNPEVDYRVYQLQKESWAGIWVAARCFTDCDGIVSNRDLLGLGLEPLRAVRIALDFFNSDLQARGETWRLGVEVPAVPSGDPRRV